MAEPPEPAADPPYQSLYRRFRPQRFADVKGQDHVIRALVNTVRDGHVAHAYLFSGPRGTGKTSTARILAMALNCEHPVDGEPDGTCASCVDIRRGVSTDVQELDAASNRRIDEMRDLLSRVALGTRGRWKVYIIDEVHQLTGDAASALLKTLEEPPAHVVFVLATTDPQKVLPTIRSRTIHFDFHLLPSEVLGDLLRTVNQAAGLGVPPEAIDLVVRRGHGSARDALTVLDQVAAGGGVEDQSQMVSQIVDGLAERDAGLALTAVAQGMAAGRDARRLAADLLDHLRNAFLATMARGLVMLPDDAVTELAEQARRLGLAALVRAMEVIGQALADMRDSVDPRVTLEVALVRLARPDADASPAALLERIERLERSAGSGAPARAIERPAPPTPRPSERPAPAPGSPGRSPLPPPPMPASGAGVSPGPAGPRRAAAGVPGAVASVPVAGSGDSSERVIPPAAGAGGEAGPVGPRPPAVPGSGAGGSSGRVVPPAAGAGGSSGPVVPGPPLGPGSPRPPMPVAPAPPLFPDGPAPAGRGGLALPSRDELTLAWGDGVLRGLSPKAKAYVANGRFVSVGPEAAVFALPNQHLLERSRDARVEAEAALAARFGRPVPLRLVVEPAAGASPEAESEEELLDQGDLDHLQDADVAVISPEQRLMDAFPGAEEVST
jgi:DNA polymerase III subunit gamma/tau